MSKIYRFSTSPSAQNGADDIQMIKRKFGSWGVPESLDLITLLTETKRLNPEVGDFEVKWFFGSATPQITFKPYPGFENVNLEDLKYPGVYCFTPKNGITNKHRTKSSAYDSRRVTVA